MTNRRRTRTLPTRKGPFVRRSDVLALLQREYDAAIARGDGADLLVRAECRGAAQALTRVAREVETMWAVGDGNGAGGR